MSSRLKTRECLSLEPGRNAWRLCHAQQSGLLVDARDYYKTFAAAAARAERYLLLCGWQFDSTVKLVRGEDQMPDGAPPELRAFLAFLLERRPELQIYLLAWDYAVWFAPDRELFQASHFDIDGGERVHFQFDTHPIGNGCHHQKFVVVDGVVGFAGGLDICESRWDDRKHRPQDPRRENNRGEHCKPFHDVQVGFTGEVVRAVEEVFLERWRAATGESLELPEPSTEVPDLEALSGGALLSINCRDIAVSRTRMDGRIGEGVTEVEALFVDAIASARQLIYIETQYFTAHALREALVERFRRADLPRLTVVVVMPQEADSSKEQLVLGALQDRLLDELGRVAEETGHAFFAVSPVTGRGAEQEQVFIHGKLLIVDDRLLSVGSANLTNRSLRLDTELNLTWVCRDGEDPLSQSIRDIRVDLLREHSDVQEPERLEEPEALVATLRELLQSQDASLIRRTIKNEEEPGILAALADPEKPASPFQILTEKLIGGDAPASRPQVELTSP